MLSVPGVSTMPGARIRSRSVPGAGSCERRPQHSVTRQDEVLSKRRHGTEAGADSDPEQLDAAELPPGPRTSPARQAVECEPVRLLRREAVDEAVVQGPGIDLSGGAQRPAKIEQQTLVSLGRPRSLDTAGRSQRPVRSGRGQGLRRHSAALPDCRGRGPRRAWVGVGRVGLF